MFHHPTYQIGTQYDVGANGFRRPKHIQREIIRLEQADEEQRMIEEALSQEPPEHIKAALEIVQQDHEAVGRLTDCILSELC
jgi:hypothetical protein